MSKDGTDDEALTWAGDSEPPVETPREPAAKSAAQGPKIASGWKVVGKPGAPMATTAEAELPVRTQMSSVTLVVHGVLAGVYLLYTIGWLIVLQRDTAAPSDIIGGAMYSLGLWFAVLAPALWFGATLWLTRASVSSRTRLLALAVGVLVLVPVPMLLGGAS